MPEKGTVVLPRSMAFNTYGSGNYEGIAQASEPLLKWLPGVKALQAVMSHDHGTPSFVVCMLRAGQDAYLRFIIAFAACWHVYLMMLSCFRDQKHVAVAAVECPAAKRNLMVAQLCQRYNEIFHDARGNARLLRVRS